MDLLRDSIWQFVGVIVGLIALFITVWLARRSRRKRSLTCEFRPIEIPVEIEADEAIRKEIQIHYKGRAVQNLSVVTCRLKNTGNLPIRNSHVVKPITFSFGSAVELMGAPQVLDRFPRNLEVDWQLHEHGPDKRLSSVGLNFELFNPGDELTVKFTCAGESPQPEVATRIEGLTEIEMIDFGERRQREAAILAAWEANNALAKIAAIIAAISVLAWILIYFAVPSFNIQEPLADGILETLASSIRSVLFNVRTDPSYRSGFVWGLIAALVIGSISRQLLFWWNRLLQLREAQQE